jgi:hypothetical protein
VILLGLFFSIPCYIGHWIHRTLFTSKSKSKPQYERMRTPTPTPVRPIPNVVKEKEENEKDRDVKESVGLLYSSSNSLKLLETSPLYRSVEFNSWGTGCQTPAFRPPVIMNYNARSEGASLHYRQRSSSEAFTPSFFGIEDRLEELRL